MLSMAQIELESSCEQAFLLYPVDLYTVTIALLSSSICFPVSVISKSWRKPAEMMPSVSLQ